MTIMRASHERSMTGQLDENGGMPLRSCFVAMKYSHSGDTGSLHGQPCSMLAADGNCHAPTTVGRRRAALNAASTPLSVHVRQLLSEHERNRHPVKTARDQGAHPLELTYLIHLGNVKSSSGFVPSNDSTRCCNAHLHTTGNLRLPTQ